MRDRVADLLDWVAVRIWSVAHHVRPVTPPGALCPDCEIAPDRGPDVECEVCAERAEINQRIRDAYDTGLEDGAGRRW